MKKSVKQLPKRLLSFILTLVMLSTLIVPSAIVVASADIPTYTPDTSWYTGAGEGAEFVLTTPQQVLGFAQLLNQDTYFEGQYIKLGADIDLNPGWDGNLVIENGAVTSTPTVATNVWPIDRTNSAHRRFRGCFDGQGHVLSGICINYTPTAGGKNASLLGILQQMKSTFTDCGVRNLIITNSSYVRNSTGGNYYGIMAGLFSHSQGGVIENCYLDIDLINYTEDTPLMAGVLYQKATDMKTTDTNAVLGTVIRDTVYAGSMVAYNKGSTTLYNKTNSDWGYSRASQMWWSGFVNNVNTTASGVTFTRCLDLSTMLYNTGYVTKTGDGQGVGSRANFYNTGSGAVKNDCATAFTEAREGWTDASVVATGIASCIPTNLYNLTGMAALVEELTPHTTTPDTSWYTTTAAGAEFTLTTDAELLGFAKLLNEDTRFTGQIIKLGADIDLNPGWDGNLTFDGNTPVLPSTPLNAWPVSKQLSGHRWFEGSFNGQGHTVSGIYAYLNDTAGGRPLSIFGIVCQRDVNFTECGIKNVKFENCYLERRSNKTTVNGIVAGLCSHTNGATIENVYADIDLINISADRARMAGIVYQKATDQSPIQATNIVDVVYAGSMAAYQSNGTSLDNHAESTYSSFVTNVNTNASGVNFTRCLDLGTKVYGTVSAQSDGYGGTNEGAGGAVSFYNRGTGVTKTDCRVGETTTEGEGWAYLETSQYFIPALVAETFFADDVSDYALWYFLHQSDSEFTLTTAKEVLEFFDLLATGTTFVGKTIKLGNDIDLNPGWTGNLTFTGSGAGATATFPEAPENAIYTGDKLQNNSNEGRWFHGTFDGQGHVLSGVYSSYTNSGLNAAGIFGNLGRDGYGFGVIQNLAITNSYLEYRADRAQAQMSGICSCLRGDAKILNCYFDVDLAMRTANNKDGYIGALSCYGGTVAGKTAEIANVVWAGTIGDFAGTNSEAIKSGTSNGRIGLFYQNANGVVATATDVLNMGSIFCNLGSQEGNGYSTKGNGGNSVALTRVQGSFVKNDLAGYKQDSYPDGGDWTYSQRLKSFVPTYVYTNFFPNPPVHIVTDEDIQNFSDEDSEGSSYLIDSLADLIYFGTIANQYDLSGKTFKLDADIVFNADFDPTETVANFAEAPTNVWIPAGTFEGIFDGQGHKIVGLYSVTTGNGIAGFNLGGLFNTLTGTIQNLVITNSFIGLKMATTNNTNEPRFGGMVGTMADGSSISNVVFDAEVFVQTRGKIGFGGIAARATGATTIEYLVYSGHYGLITPEGAYKAKLGAACGFGYLFSHGNGQAITLSDVLILAKNGVNNMSASAGVNNIYYLVHWGLENVTGAATVKIGAQTDAIDGWTNDANFGSYTPTTLTTTTPIGAYVPKARVDASLSNAFDSRDSGSYVITSAADLKLFNTIAQYYSFAGDTIKLTADIDLNAGWISNATVSSGTVTFPLAPSYVWSQIPDFRGTLDGQGHSISGFYRYVTALGDSGTAGGIFLNLYGATIKNLVVTNSFFGAQRSGSGSQEQKFGGLVRSINSGTTTIQNVFFNAEVWFKTDNNRTAGMLAAEVVNSGTLTVSNTVLAGRFGHCQNDGTIAASSGSSAKGVIAGNANGKPVTLDQVLIVAEITLDAVKDTGTKDEKTVHYGPGGMVGLNTVYYGLQDVDCPDGWIYDGNILSYSPTTLTADYVRLDVDAPLANFNGKAKIGSSYVIATREDMINFMLRINTSAGKGAGYTFKLTADINLNPGWRATPTIDEDASKITFPTAPETVWSMPEFKGTFNGQGHYVAGLYRNNTSAANWDKVGGFCDELKGGTVQNVKFVNGLVIANAPEKDDGNQKNVRLGSIAGITYNDGTRASRINNVYIDMHVWVGGWQAQAVGGIIGQPDNAIEISNVTFAGTVGTTYPYTGGLQGQTLTYPTNNKESSVAQGIGDAKVIDGNRYETIVLAGTAYYSNEQTRSGVIFGKGIDTVREDSTPINIIVGRYATYAAALSESAIQGEYQGESDFAYVADLGYIVPVANSNMGGYAGLPGAPTTQSITEYTGAEIKGSVYTISNSAELLYAAELSQSGVNFKGFTLRLTADIDLNPGWSAAVEIADGTNVATVPMFPTVIFPGFKNFYGTLDGQDHTISGVAMYKLFQEDGENLGFIEYLYGNVRNLKLINGLIYGEAHSGDAGKDRRLGGVAARVMDESATLENLYVEMNVWMRGRREWERVGGIVGRTDNGAVLNNVVFAGVVGTINFAGEGNNVPANSATENNTVKVAVSQLVADGNWSSKVYISNCSMDGTVYVKDGAVVGAISSNANLINVQDPLEDATYTGSAYTNNVPAFNIFPTATVDRYHTGYELDTTTKTYYFEDITRANFTAYINTLKAAGYTVEQEYSISDNAYVLLQNGVYTVFASRITSNGYTNGEMFRARVYVEPYGREYNTQKDATPKSTYCQPQLWQLNVDNNYSNANGGASYVIRLSDGRFLVFDGGYASRPECNNLYKVLYENNVRVGNPVVAGWFFSHAHEDHVGAVTRFVKWDHKDDITVEAFYFNFPTDPIADNDEDNNTADTMSPVEVMKPLMATTYYKNAKVYSKIHTGQTFGFADATVTVLYTHEDAYQSYWKNTTLTANSLTGGNDSSTVFKITVGSETILFTGDAAAGADNAMYYTYAPAVLQSKFVTVSHHGYLGLSRTFYQRVNPTIALWPNDLVGYTGSVKDDNKAAVTDSNSLFPYLYNHSGSSRSAIADYWFNSSSSVQEVIPAYENACLTLPYNTPKTYSGGSKTVNISEKVTWKKQEENWDGQIVAINEWYDAEEDELYINNRKDLFDFMKAGQKYNFYGKTVILNTDVSANPSWTYDGLIENDFLVDAPAGLDAWKPIPAFAGTFDGQGHTIRNLYIPVTVKGGAYNGGFFDSVSSSAVIQNLIIKSSAMVATYNVDQGTSSTKIGGFIGRLVDNYSTGNVAILTNLYIDLDVYYRSGGVASLAGLVGTLTQTERANPDYSEEDKEAAENAGESYDIPEKITCTLQFSIRDVVYAGDVICVAKNGQVGGQINIASGQHMYGPVGLVGLSDASLGEDDLIREATNVLFLGNLTPVANESTFSSGSVFGWNDYNLTDVTTENVYGSARTEAIEGWTMNDDLNSYIPENVNDMLAEVVKSAVAQQSAEYTLTGTNTKAVDLRFIGVLTGILDEADLGNYSEVGMIITSKRGDQVLFTTEMTTTTVYESLQAGDDLYDMNDAGGFLYAFVIKGVTLNAEVDFYITTFSINSDTTRPMEERRVNNEEMKFVYDGGLKVAED